MMPAPVVIRKKPGTPGADTFLPQTDSIGMVDRLDTGLGKRGRRRDDCSTGQEEKYSYFDKLHERLLLIFIRCFPFGIKNNGHY